jgi:putative aldouronate transport system substrate-binding protein
MYQVSRRQALITIGAFTLVLTGCGEDAPPAQQADDLSKNRVGAMPNYGVGVQFKATAPLTFEILYNNHPFYPNKKDWLFWSELTKRTNVTLATVEVPLSDYENKRSLLIGSGDAPPIIPKTYPGQEEPFVGSGTVLPVSDYLHLMPNFQDKVGKWKMQPDLNTLRQDDGRFYLLPGMHEQLWVDYSLAIRTDILEQLNLEVPKTWEELYTVLKAMKAEYPDLYPMTDRWGIPTPGGNLLNIIGQAYGTRGGWDYQNATWDAKAGKFQFTGAMPQYRQMLEYVGKLVAEKLLDPESFTQEDENAERKFTSGKSFVISTNAQTLVNDYRGALEEQVPGATIAKIPVPLGPVGNYKIGSRTRLENGIMLSKEARESEHFVAMMQFIDWLWYSDAGLEFAKWGVEGTTYTKDSSGKYKLADDVDYVGLNPGASKHLQQDFGFGNGVFAYGGSTALLQSTFSEEEIAFQNVMNARQPWPVHPPRPLTEEEREQSTLWDSPLRDHVEQNTLRFILGERPLSEWDAYVAELEGKNMTSYINVMNTAYQRYKQKHG